MFYTYIYKDPRPTKNHQVVYVGKGQGERAWKHWNKSVQGNKGFGNLLALLRKLNLEPIIEITQEFATEQEAFDEERRLIKLYGRRNTNTGTLFNLTDGGEGTAGLKYSFERLERHKEAHRSPESRAKNSQKQKEKWSNPDYREKMLALLKTAAASPKARHKRAIALVAYCRTPKFKETMRQASLKMWQNPEYAEKVRQGQIIAQNTEKALQTKSKNSKALWENKHAEMSAKIKAGRSTDESREKTRQQMAKQYADPEYREKRAAQNREVANRPEVKAAKSAAAKAQWAKRKAEKAAQLDQQQNLT